MSLLNGMKTDKTIQNERDSLGGFSPLDSDLYDLKIKLAFLTVATTEAIALNLHCETDAGKAFRAKLWIQSGKKKGATHYFKDKQGSKQYLPGFNQANAICLLTVGKELSDMVTEDKVINLYDPTQKKEVPTKVEMLMDILGEKFKCGIIKQIVDVTSLNDGTGQYEPTGKTRFENEIDKIFRSADGFTATEIRAKLDKPLFIHEWTKKWAGEVKDKSTSGAKPGSPAANSSDNTASGKAAAKTSLFEDV